MVEGPGCTLNKEKIRSRVQKGQKVLEVRGSAAAKSNDSNRSSFQIFCGCPYTGVETLGKELFMYFGQRALRVHFGMNGSVRINPTARKDRAGPPPVLVVQLTNDTVCFFDSTVEIRLTEDCEQKVHAMESLDVSCPKFNASRAAAAVRREGGRLLCDVLLDQAVLPGVGNIIKNEALFDSGLHPAVKVNQLTSEQVHHLVKMTRDFTLLFYKCRKSGSSLQKHYRVYKRPQCGQCSGTVTVCRLGDNSRMTYFCQRCQSADPSEVNISKLPARSSEVGWAYQGDGGSSEHVAKKEEEEWACDLCTLINRPISKSCEACLTPRPELPARVQPSPFSRDLIRYPCNAFTKPPQERKVNWRSAFGNTTLIFTEVSPLGSPLGPADSPLNATATTGGFSTHTHGHCQGKTGPGQALGGARSRGAPVDPCRQPSKRMKTEHVPFPGNDSHFQSRSSTSAPQAKASAVPPATHPCCVSHRRPGVLRVVSKEGGNRGRQFYTCSLPRETQCNFFEWADLHFPTCNHGKRTLMRTVLKLGPNNGRNFYVCPFKKGAQCDFFQWAENGPGTRILPGC